MIVIWLGSFFLMVYGMQQSQKNLSQLLGFLQKKLFAKSLEVDFLKMLYRMTDIVLLEASPRQSMQTGLALYNLRVLAKRPSILLIGLSTVGGWWVLILGFLFMQLSGVLLFGFCSLMLLSFLQFEKLQLFFKIILFTGVFLTGAELMTRNSAMLQEFLGESDIAFWIADGRWPALLGIFIIGFLVTWVIEVEFWTFCLGLALLLASVISFNGALALFAGERCARAIIFLWSGQKLNQDCRLIAQQMGGASALGAFLGLILVFVIREFLNLSASYGFKGASDRSFYFLLLVIFILLIQFLAQMLMGHFAAQQEVLELQDVRYFPKSWFKNSRLSPEALLWAKLKVEQRIQEIRYHLQGLTTFQAGQIPDHVQARLKAEELELTKLHEQF